jgi:hypothetical protein
MPRLVTLILLLAATLLTATTVSFADHSWANYHWQDGNLSPTVLNKSVPTDVFDVPLAVQEWADLSTPLQPVMASGGSGDVEVIMKRMNANWLGVARIWVDGDGHIQKGRVELNRIYLNSLTAVEWDHVLCQELGHIWGLGHNPDGAAGGTPDDTCMNGSQYLGQYPAPNLHDAAQLNAIYDHTDVIDEGGEDDGGGGGGGGNCPPRNPNCQFGAGQWITVDVFPIP